jgi:NAD(P)-dependent dehydrogenase (short-subunit alcohol dehydrogenase family)
MSERGVKTVLVTGASRGLGRSLAVAFAARGAHVIGTGRDESALEDTEALCSELPGAFEARQLEVRDQDSIDELLRTIGVLDICVANAGVAEIQPLLETSQEGLRRVFDVNFFGAFSVMRDAAAPMIARGEGRIFAIASDAALKGIPTMAAYVASKHALLGLMRTFALELAGTGVHVTTVFPGGIVTDILGSFASAGPMDPDEVAEAIVALADVGASIGSCELHLQPSAEIPAEQRPTESDVDK